MTIDAAAVFDDLVRVETLWWDVADARLRSRHEVALSWFEPMSVIDRTAGCRIADVSAALSITVGGASKLVDRIEQAGWCRRRQHPDDGRSSVIELTAAGRRKLHAAEHTFRAANTDVLGAARLSDSELVALQSCLTRLRAALTVRREGA